MASYKITLSQSNWSGGTAAIWYDTATAAFYSDSGLTTAVTSITPPTRELYRFNGFYSSSSNGTQYIDGDGNFTAALYALSITAARTFYAQGTQVSYKLTLNDNSGSGGDGVLYYKIDGGGFYAHWLCDSEGPQITHVTKPTRANYAFAGYHNGTTTPGTQYIDEAGDFTSALSSLSLTAAKTIYARWVAPFKITISANRGTGGTAAFYFDSIGGKFYAEQNMAEEITAIVPHTRECFAFAGCYSSNNTTSTLRVLPSGEIVAADWTPTAAVTIYAQWTRVSWKITLNKQSGTGGTSALYYRIDGGGLYVDDLCDTAATGVTPPTRSGYTFSGFYSATSGGTQYTDADGAFLAAFTSLTPTAAVTIYARWTANTYTLTFNYNGGTHGAETKTVTFGAAVGTLPTTTRTPDVFNGWYVDGTKITADTVWNIAEDKMVEARWTLAIAASVEDFFGLASSALVPIASTNGDEYHRATAAHNGKYENGVNQISGIWRNPSVTYVVKANTTVSVQLGKAFAAQKSGSTMTRSGYMITTVEIVTEIGKFPTVTVSAVANEGANAVNNFTVNANKFNVSVAVVARSKAQNLLNAISGGGYLQRVTLRGTCDPVVCEENLMPCASDIVNGRYELAAETVAPNGEAAPTMAASAGFAMVGVPKVGADSNFVRYSIDGRKEMV